MKDISHSNHLQRFTLWAFLSGCLGGFIVGGSLFVLGFVTDSNIWLSSKADILRTRRHPVTNGLEIFGDLHVHGTVHSAEFLYQVTSAINTTHSTPETDQ